MHLFPSWTVIDDPSELPTRPLKHGTYCKISNIEFMK